MRRSHTLPNQHFSMIFCAVALSQICTLVIAKKQNFLNRKCSNLSPENTQLSEFCACRSALIIPPSERDNETQAKAASCLVKRKEAHRVNRKCKVIVGKLKSLVLEEEVSDEEKLFAKQVCKYAGSVERQVLEENHQQSDVFVKFDKHKFKKRKSAHRKRDSGEKRPSMAENALQFKRSTDNNF